MEEQTNIEYYRIDLDKGKKFFATESKEALLKRLGSPRKKAGPIRIFGYKLKTLTKVTEEQASIAHYFREFAGDNNYKLSCDGVYDLGLI